MEARRTFHRFLLTLHLGFRISRFTSKEAITTKEVHKSLAVTKTLSFAEKVGSKSPPGLLYHVEGPIEGGWRVVDVWESQEAVVKFFEETLGQVLQEVGVAVPPPQFWPAHRIIKP